MSRAYEHVKAWRKRVKTLLVTAFGGGCGVCGYARCPEALEFHHPDPNEKDLGVSSWNMVASFQGVAREATKCVMLCSNCHREVHAGMLKLPARIRRFDPVLFQVERERAVMEKRAKANLMISQACRNRVSWEGIDVVALRQSGESWASIARTAQVSVAAVKKRFLKLQARISTVRIQP